MTLLQKSFSISTLNGSNVAHSGWLRKKGETIKSWKSRFCTITVTPAVLNYYEDDEMKIKKGSIDLTKVIKVINRSPPFLSPIFEIHTDYQRIYIMQAETIKELDHWIEVIHKVAAHVQPFQLPEIVQLGLIKQGMLNKKGNIRKAWKTREFTLFLSPIQHLVYRDPVESKNAEDKGSIPLMDIVTVGEVEEPGEERVENQFEIVTMQRTYKVQASTADEKEDWINVIKAAVHNAVARQDKNDFTQLYAARQKTMTIKSMSAFRAHRLSFFIVKQGWMLKKGYYNRMSWKYRYFLLLYSQNLPILKYYVGPDDTVPIGSIDISQVSGVVVDGTCSLVLKTPGRNYIFETESPLEAQEWATKIESCLKSQI